MLTKSGDPHSAWLFGAAPHEGLHIVSEAPYYKPWWGVALTIVWEKKKILLAKVALA